MFDAIVFEEFLDQIGYKLWAIVAYDNKGDVRAGTTCWLKMLLNDYFP